MPWYGCSSICRETTTKRIYWLNLRCGGQSEPKSRISSEKSKKYFFLKSSQNHLKRIETTFKIFLNIFFKKNIHLGHRIFLKFSRFSLDIAILVHHCSQTSNAMTKFFGKVVDLLVEILQLKEYIDWTYGVASRLSRCRTFRQKNQIDSESSET